LRLDYGYPIQRDGYHGGGRFNFNVGYQFWTNICGCSLTRFRALYPPFYEKVSVYNPCIDAGLSDCGSCTRHTENRNRWYAARV
jgi:hypothetical protein